MKARSGCSGTSFAYSLRRSRTTSIRDCSQFLPTRRETICRSAPADRAIRAGLRNPEDRVHKEPIILGGHTRIAFLAGQEILDAFPMFIRNRVATNMPKGVALP